MKSIYKYTSVFLCVLLLASCASVPYDKTASGILDQYTGREFTVAIQQFGPPTNIYADGQGGRILSWEQTRQYSSPGLSYATGSGRMNIEFWQNEFNATYNSNEITITKPPQVYTSTKFIQLYARENGMIYNYRHNVKSEAEINAKKNKELGQGALILGGALLFGAIYGLTAQ
jgi:hypothetical protein